MMQDKGTDMPNVSQGMKVVGVNGHNIGRVEGVQDSFFVLNRPKAPDLAVPFDACMKVEGDVVWLRVEATDIVHQGWQEASASGSTTERRTGSQ
jgi:hypothetical protein